MTQVAYLPEPDRDSAPWWEALGRHELVQQRCTACGRWRWPPRAMCGECASFEWSWQPCSGRGEVASWIVTHHKFMAGHERPEPTVFIRLDEQDDIVMPGLWRDEATPATGMPVEVVFEDVTGPEGATATLLGWRRAPNRG